MDFFHHSKQTSVKPIGATRVKICGIRSLEAAHAALDAGADFLGFNFVNESHRFINPIQAKEIINKVRDHITIVGVFKDMFHEEVNEIANFLKLHLVQLHGDEDEHYIEHIKKDVIKAFGLFNEEGHEEKIMSMRKFSVNYYMLDRPDRGEGNMLDIGKAALIAKELPIFLAGGLTVENVGEIVRKVHPYAVDVAGGVETNGEQDIGKIVQFIKNAKGIL